MEHQKKTGLQLAMRVSAVSIAVNVLLSAFKLFAGIIANSGAMISDAVHSLSDVFSTFIVIVGVKLSGKESDAKHQYGHERIECVAAVLLAVMLALTGIGIGYSGVSKIIDGTDAKPLIPGTLALVAAVVSIAVKEAMFWYTRTAAKKIDSGALMADAWHHRSDALSSVGSFIGILGARMGLPVLDPIASVVICLFIIKAAYDIFKDAMRKMTDEACESGVVDEIKRVSLSQEGVLGIDGIQTRLFGNRIYVDIEICADGAVPLKQSHGIAQRVHDAIEAAFPAVKHCMVHVNPHQPDEAVVNQPEDKSVSI